MVSVRLKQGATFEYTGDFALPVPTGSWTPRAIVSTHGGTLVQVLTATLVALTPAKSTGENYTLTISATAAQTAAWPMTRLVGDIKFTDGAGVVLKTTDYTIVVERGFS